MDVSQNLKNESQLLAKYIQTNTTSNGHLYTKVGEVAHLGDIDCLINDHNRRLYKKHHSRELCRFGKIICILMNIMKIQNGY